MGWDQFSALLRSKTVLGDEDDTEVQKSTIAGTTIAGSYYDTFEGGTDPAANTLPTGSNAFVEVSGNNGTPTHNVTAFPNVAASKTKHLLYADAAAPGSALGDIIIYDLLGFYPDFNLATAGTTATGTGVGVADITRYGTGKRVYMGILAQVSFTGTPPSVTVNYTNSSLASKSTSALTLTSTCVRGRYATTAMRVPLAAGDTGVSAVRSVTHAGGAAPTGKYAIFLYRVLGVIKIATANSSAEKSWSDPKGAFLFPRILDNAAINYAWRAANGISNPGFTATLYTADGVNPA